MVVIEKSDEEKCNKLEELKKKFESEKPLLLQENPDLFSKFLSDQDYNVTQAESMLKKHLEWRKEFMVDKIMGENIFSEDVLKYSTYCTLGLDKENTQVQYVALGNLDIKGIFMAVKFRDRVRFVIQVLEKERLFLRKQNQELGKDIPGIVYILDMKHLTFAKVTNKRGVEELIFIARMFQDNYPEHLKGVYIINASSFFTMGFAMVKNFIQANILERIHIYGGEEEYKPVLLEIMDADSLPAFLGGNKKDPNGDPMCKSFVRFGGIVPESLYTSKKGSTTEFQKSKDVKKLVLPRASFSEIELQVKEPGSIIEWEFETKTRDVGFGLFLTEIDEKGEEKITELVPLLRLETDTFSETGVYKCERAGKYVILFDNSYSWVRSKEIFYKATVINPKEHEDEMKNVAKE